MKSEILRVKLSGLNALSGSAVLLGLGAVSGAFAAETAAPPEMVPVVSKSNITLGGSARLRAEANNNRDFLDVTSDSSRFGLMRFRMDFTFKPRSDVSVFVQPQAARTWGKNEVIGTGVTSGTGAVTGTSTGTSGGAQDSRIDLHQGYVKYQASDDLNFLLGRQVLSYGDELLVGALDWSNVGRSFDALKASYGMGSVKADLFWSKITERNELTAGPGDKDFSGLYLSSSPAEWMKEADLYSFYLDESSTQPKQKTTAFGARLKSPVGSFDYRVEGTFENVRGGSEDQVDFELGYLLSTEHKTRISAEYFYSTDSFDQLFPTGHRWLGIADYFSRRNIKGERFGISSELAQGLTGALDYHLFSRTDKTAPAYNISGVSYGTTGSESALASEFDLIFKKKLNEVTGLVLGGSYVRPGAYMKDNKGPDSGYFAYTELSVLF